MVWVHRQDVGKPERVGNFAWKRFQRIYPFFWLVLAVSLIAVWVVPALGKPWYRDPLVILQSALLAGADPMKAVVFVSWTLWHEMAFYALCALVIVWPRLGVPAFVAWSLACVGLQFAPASVPWPGYLTEFVNVLFAFGVGVALALQRWRVPAPGVVLVAGAVIFLATGLALDYSSLLPEWSGRALFGLGAALALAGGVELERSGRLRSPRWLSILGAASFSIYLTHILTLTLAAKIAVSLHLTRYLPSPVAFVGLAGAAIGAGVAVHYLLERRALAVTSALRQRLRSTWAAAPG
jgi:peptidoglycan/LPS O-acetylase OafA/YrhL